MSNAQDDTQYGSFLFQFHYGSIVSKAKGEYSRAFPEFQFHYGSIVRDGLRFEPVTLPDFNSTMVRLWGVKHYPQYIGIWAVCKTQRLFPVELNPTNFYGLIEALYILLIENLRFIGG